MKLIKTIMKVKTGTTNDLVLHELRRGDIVCRIKDRQYKFFKKLSEVESCDAIVNQVIKICKNNKMIKYYQNLRPKNYESDIKARAARILESTNTLSKYYVSLNLMQSSSIYESFMNDNFRFLITRWRLSNHDLLIEVGRYSGLDRDERRCTHYNVVEDEEHVIFVCPRYTEIRNKYELLLQKNEWK